MFRKKPKYFYQKNIVATLLTPLSWLYILVFSASKIKLKKPINICPKTICVGNIVVGGSGKTPICLELCKLFQQKGKNVCFVTKGYGREKKTNTIVPCQHYLVFNAKEIGDEALLLNNQADVQVVNKRKQGNCHNYDVAICDDGFFDNTIQKTCNIAVFDGRFFMGNKKVLPAGPLRYRIKSLKKADFIIVTNTTEMEFLHYLAFLLHFSSIDKILLAKLVVKSTHNKRQKYLAFSGIGENSKFIDSLKAYGLNVVKEVGFEDHKKYTQEDIELLKQQFITSTADKFITTSKDYVKLPKDFCEAMRVEVFEIGYDIQDKESIFDFVFNKKNA